MKLILILLFFLVFQNGHGQEISCAKCDITKVELINKNFKNLSYRLINDFLCTIDSSCINNIEYSEYSNATLFRVLEESPILFFQAINTNRSIDNESILKIIESPLDDNIDLQLILKQVELYFKEGDLKLKYENSLNRAIEKIRINGSHGPRFIFHDEPISMDSIRKGHPPGITFINDTTEGSKEFWRPTEDQLNLIDRIIVRAIKKEIKRVGIGYHKRLNPSSYKKYYRQYVCYKSKRGDFMVYINALYPYDDQWPHEIIQVFDGSDCYWQILINISKKKCEKFNVNGEA